MLTLHVTELLKQTSTTCMIHFEERQAHSTSKAVYLINNLPNRLEFIATATQCILYNIDVQVKKSSAITQPIKC